MSAITFSSGAYSWTPTRSPEEPTEAPHYEQATAVTAGGIAYGYDPVTSWRTIPLVWGWLPDSDITDLLAFLDAMGWLAGQFTVTEPGGASYTAELDAPTVETVEKYPGGKAVRITIRRSA